MPWPNLQSMARVHNPTILRNQIIRILVKRRSAEKSRLGIRLVLGLRGGGDKYPPMTITHAKSTSNKIFPLFATLDSLSAWLVRRVRGTAGHVGVHGRVARARRRFGSGQPKDTVKPLRGGCRRCRRGRCDAFGNA